MTLWIIIWCICGIFIALLSAMEVINGSIELRFWIIVFLIIFLFFSFVLVVSTYQNSLSFYEEYSMFKASVQNLTPGQEYMIFGKCLNYNYYLWQYQQKVKAWGILSPYTRKIAELTPITLNSYDLEASAWWR